MRKRLLQVLLALLPFIPGSLFAEGWKMDDQAIQVSGVVRDGADPIPGANVLIKGTTTGTVTDVNGRYTLQVSSDDVLVFSFIGYKTQEVRVGTQTSIDVVLESDVAQLAEVIVVGAAIKKTDLTGAISQLDGEKLTEVPTTSITQAMTGRMTGVLIQNSPGVSGGASIQIRGNNSIQFGTNPIFVVDGLIMDGGRQGHRYLLRARGRMPDHPGEN
ncbi:MAG TPA: carboxypeptidase-like regulatory domain-containing protein, partial [Cyclobacteriaceae bacterium]|nr:carboxypeptidase-like regulatory domain-containing protein [Cyclobacteriaceae bacterium]